MKVIDVYKQYFEAECVFNTVPRRGAVVTLTATSEEGNITYDAYASQRLYSAKGRRSKKREAELMKGLRAAVDGAAARLGGTVFWDKPLREAQFG